MITARVRRFLLVLITPGLAVGAVALTSSALGHTASVSSEDPRGPTGNRIVLDVGSGGVLFAG